MNSLFTFLASRNGRYTRIVAGVVLLIIGLAIGFQSGSLVGWIIAVIGIGPIYAGTFDVCLFAPFFGHAFKGADLRAELSGAAPPPPANDA
jgi:hypothetical protein